MWPLNIASTLLEMTLPRLVRKRLANRSIALVADASERVSCRAGCINIYARATCLCFLL